MRVVLQHHPDRAFLLERTAHLNPIVVTDPGGAIPSPWRCYVECLKVVASLGEPATILQDDAMVGEGFTAVADLAWEHRQADLVSWFVQGLSKRGGNSCRHSRTEGSPWAMLERNEWMPAVAVAWSPEVAACAIEWQSGNKRSRWTADDAMIGFFCRSCGYDMCATVPSLVDHPDDVPSIMGSSPGGAGRRAIFPPPSLTETLSIDWSVGLPAAPQRSLRGRRRAA